jgi:GT2 family glycosyltransferase
MLLSIVECDDYRLQSLGHKSKRVIKKVSDDIEIIGPILGLNVAQMRNRGASLALGEWIFFKDKDCAIDPQKILMTLKKTSSLDSRIAAISGVYASSNLNLISNCYNLIQRKWVYYGLIKKLSKNIFEANHLLGGAYLVKRNVLLDLNGFNEKIGWGCEEADLTKRIQSHGYKTVVNYNLRIKHQNHLRIFGFIKRAWWQNFNKTRFKVNFNNPSPLRNYLITKRMNYLPTLTFFSVAIFAQKWGLVFRLKDQVIRYFS